MIVDTILKDPSASNWLKRAIAENLQRDPVDALNDIEALKAVFEERMDGAVPTSENEW